MAKQLKIEKDSGRLKVSYSWRTGAMWFMVLWCVVWDGSIIFALLGGAGVFISLHLLAGVMVTWYTLTRFLNRTTITIDRQLMKVDHGPIPWPFAKKHEITSRSLQQLYVDKSAVQQNKQSTYSLMAILDTGAELKLLDAEPDLSVVQSLERTIEGYLEIDNDPTLDLTSSGRTPKELEKMYEGVKKMREAVDSKKWVPDFIKEQVQRQEEALRMEMRTIGESTDTFSPRRTNAPSSSPLDADGPITIRSGAANPRPLPTPDHNFDYPLFAQPEGTQLSYLSKRYRLGRTAQIDWTDEHSTTARQLELIPTEGGDNLYFFVQLERERWAYYEERRLDDDEVAALGFEGEVHPLRFNNGDERYYPRDRQKGTRFLGTMGQSVEQYIYFTTSSTAQFRALKPSGRGWEVYVMEPVDAGVFDA